LVTVGALLLGIAIVAIAYLAGMRTKSPLLLKPLIRLQRTFINPRQMRSAGTAGAYAGIIRHRGRNSGRLYETPIGVVPVDDGFIIALVYGPDTNWLRNVLASGSATIVHDGATYAVDHPEVVPMPAVIDHFPTGDQRGFRWLGVDQALRVRRAAPERAGDGAAAATHIEGSSAQCAEAGSAPRSRQAA
jgi:deazaflavin-dependent oxidoreductase (nitroreductase family)